MITKLRNYLSLIKFAHTIFAMPFALIGFFLAIKFSTASTLNLNSTIGWGANKTFYYDYQLLQKFILVILSMIFARSAAMAFNRYLDRNFDERNPRTAIREIPSGIITSKNALIFVILNCIAFIITCWFINTLCFWLSFAALFVILFYSYTKRFTALSHLVLGLGLSLAPIGAYLAVTGKFDFLPTLFSLTVLFWVSGFDIIYALQDEEFDKVNNLKSIPAALGKRNALRVSKLFHFLSAICVAAAGYYGNFHSLYWTGASIFLLLLIYQHSLVKANNLSKVNLAFFTTNGIASAIFCIFVLMDLFNNKNFFFRVE